MVGPFSHRVAPGIDHIQVQVTIVIKVGKRAFGILQAAKASLRRYIGKGPVSVVPIENQVGMKIPDQKIDKSIVVIVAAGNASPSPKGIGSSCKPSNIPEYAGS